MATRTPAERASGLRPGPLRVPISYRARSTHPPTHPPFPRLPDPSLVTTCICSVIDYCRERGTGHVPKRGGSYHLPSNPPSERLVWTSAGGRWCHPPTGPRVYHVRDRTACPGTASWLRRTVSCLPFGSNSLLRHFPDGLERAHPSMVSTIKRAPSHVIPILPKEARSQTSRDGRRG